MWTWRRTKPSFCPITGKGACGRFMPMLLAGLTSGRGSHPSCPVSPTCSRNARLKQHREESGGMPQQRDIPRLRPRLLKAGFGSAGQRSRVRTKVILWADTFNNYFRPETAQAAVDVLEAAGFQVKVPQMHLCCGSPLYDYGFLDMAKSYLERMLNTLSNEIDAGTPMVVLEPSCCSVFRDELIGLMPEVPRAHKLAEQTFTLAEFLEKKTVGYQPPTLKRKAIVQGHCHHKAIMRMKEEEEVMQKLGLDYQVLSAGCCGMAGSFGYEKEKYDVSIKAGERALLPAVRKAGFQHWSLRTVSAARSRSNKKPTAAACTWLR